MIRTAHWWVIACLALSCGSSHPGRRAGRGNGLPQMNDPVRLHSLENDPPPEEKPATGSVACNPRAGLPDDLDGDVGATGLHEKGQALILARRGHDALPILVVAHDKAPEDPHILGDLAIAYLQCDLPDEAVKYAERASALALDDVDITANLAQIYQIVGRVDEAIAKYRRAIDLDPADPAAYNNLAVLLVAKTHYKDAELAVREAMTLSPKNVSYMVNLSYILYKQGRLVDAEMILNRAAATEPQNANIFNQLGVILAAQKRIVKAKEQFRKALELNPRHRAAKENLDALDQEDFQLDTP